MGTLWREEEEKDANTYEAEPERKPNEIMINIVSNASFSFLLFGSFGMNDDRKKQTERQIHTHIYTLCYLTTQGHFLFWSYVYAISLSYRRFLLPPAG